MSASNLIYFDWKISAGALVSDTPIDTSFRTLCAMFMPANFSGSQITFLGYDDKGNSGLIRDISKTIFTALTANPAPYLFEPIVFPPGVFFGFSRIAIVTDVAQVADCYIKAACRPC